MARLRRSRKSLRMRPVRRKYKNTQNKKNVKKSGRKVSKKNKAVCFAYKYVKTSCKNLKV